MQNVFTKSENFFRRSNIYDDIIIKSYNREPIWCVQTEEEKKIKKKIIMISTIIGCIAFICTFAFIVFNEQVDLKPYTDYEIHELYVQRASVHTQNYKYEEMHDFKYSVNFKSNYYENIYENSQAMVIEKVDYKGKILSLNNYDKAKDKRIIYISDVVISLVFSLFIGGLIGTLLKKYID